MLVADNEVVGIRESGDIDAKSAGIDATPRHAVAGIHNSDAMMIPASDARHIPMPTQAIDRSWT